MRSGQNGTSLGKFVDILTGGHAETSTCLHGALKMKNVSDFEAKKKIVKIIEGFTGPDYQGILERQPHFAEATVKRAGRELAAALGKPYPLPNRKRRVEDEGEDDAEKRRSKRVTTRGSSAKD